MSAEPSTYTAGGSCRAVVAERLDWWCGEHGCPECRDAYHEDRVPSPHEGLRVWGSCDTLACNWGPGLFPIVWVSTDEVGGLCPACGSDIVVDVSRDPF